MKLLATLALAQFSEAALTCTGGNMLFVSTCSVDGFHVEVDEACRNELFSYVYFADSFMWGTKAVDSMEDPAGNVGTAVVSSYTGTCSSVKPTDTNGKYEWDIPLSDCAMEAEYDSTLKGTTYTMYWNSQEIVGSGAGTHEIMNLGQVRFTCKLKDHQVDAVFVTVSEDSLVDDQDVDFNLKNIFSIQVNMVPAADATLPNQSKQVDGNSGQLTYTEQDTTTAKVGDYMELELMYDVASYPSITVTMQNCWASDLDNQLPSTDGGSTFDPEKAFQLWDNFCPKYANVGPSYGLTAIPNGYLMEWWDQTTPMHRMHFSQFAFLDTQKRTPYSTIYYHCWLKICPAKDIATCSANAGCVNPAPISPGRRRRSTEEVIVTTKIGVKNVDAADCAKTSHDGKVCIEAYTAAENSGNMALPTCLALAALPFLH